MGCAASSDTGVTATPPPKKAPTTTAAPASAPASAPAPAPSKQQEEKSVAASPVADTIPETVDKGIDTIAESITTEDMEELPNASGKSVERKRQFDIVFAAPLTDVSGFQAPKFPKSALETRFIKEAILQNFIFGHLTSTESTTLVEAFEKISHPKSSTIIKQGDTGDYFYVIHAGSVAFEVSGKQVGTAEKGKTFGELSLLYTSPRAATVVAKEDCELFRVDQKTFRYIMQQQTETANDDKKELLYQVPFLQELDPLDVQKLALAMTPRQFSKDEYLVKKGEEGDAFYVIQEGEVRVNGIEVGGKQFEDILLRSGDFFGERALVTKEPRAANCIGQTDGLALCIDKETFEKVMGNLDELVLKATDKRFLSAIKVIQTTNLDSIEMASIAELIVDQEFEAGTKIFSEDDEVPSALYIVREGKVKVTSEDERYNNIIEQGGFFGDEMLCRDAQSPDGATGDPVSTASYTVEVLDKTTVGCLTLEECRTVIDTKKIGKGTRSHRFQSVKDSDIQIKALKKHAILGAGTFGQVWLVSRLASDSSRVPYALKIQSKYELIKSHQAKGVVQERDLMGRLQHPFIIRLVNTYQDRSRVYMLLDIVQGGELFSIIHTDTSDSIPESNAKFYGAGMLEGMAYMHRRHILYRDLKPENVLIDDEGYPVIVDLGFAKYVIDKTYTLCGTPLYIAPEVVLNRGHDKGADHWSLGVLIFEMIVGTTPFYKDGMDQMGLFRAIVKGNFKFPKKNPMSTAAEDLISKILVTDPTQRLGSLAHGEKDIFKSDFFSDIDFGQLRRKEIRAPWLPTIKSPLDTSNFEAWDHLQDKTKVKDPPLSRKDDEVFSAF